jgi:hypothetical protein
MTNKEKSMDDSKLSLKSGMTGKHYKVNDSKHSLKGH